MGLDLSPLVYGDLTICGMFDCWLCGAALHSLGANSFIILRPESC